MRAALLEDELTCGEHQELKLRELLRLTEFLLNEYKDIYFQADNTLENVYTQLENMQRDCVCHGGFHRLFRARSR